MDRPKLYEAWMSRALVWAVAAGLLVACPSNPSSESPSVLPPPSPVEGERSLIWWGVMGFELQIEGTIIQTDPYFRIHRRGDYILCTSSWQDHCSTSSQERVLSISPALEVILTPTDADEWPTTEPLTRRMSAGDVYEDDLVWAKAFHGFGAEGSPELAWLIRERITGLTFLHGGDATDSSFEYLREAFREVQPERIDYYLTPLGKVSIEKMKSLLREFEPRHIVPGHYPFMIRDISNETSTVEFPGSDVPYMRPDYTIEWFAETITSFIEEEGLATRLLLVSPGQEIALSGGQQEGEPGDDPG